MRVAWSVTLLLSALAALDGVAPSLADGADVLARYEQTAIAYFLNEADPVTGLVKDRAANFGEDAYTVSSLAATGFGLACLPIAAKRGWLPSDEAQEQARVTLDYLLHDSPHEHGWYYHFVDMRTGARVWNCELSSIDTALLVAGALTAGAAFGGARFVF